MDNFNKNLAELDKIIEYYESVNNPTDALKIIRNMLSDLYDNKQNILSRQSYLEIEKYYKDNDFLDIKYLPHSIDNTNLE